MRMMSQVKAGSCEQRRILRDREPWGRPVRFQSLTAGVAGQAEPLTEGAITMTHAIVHFRDWLRDAHAMEVQAIALLSAQIARIENYPELRERLELHLAQTEGHASALQSLLERAQDSPSMLRDVAGRVTAAAQGMSGIMASDEVVKATIAAYGFEHAEIARYLVLIAAADELGDTEAVDVFRRILAEEQVMADWLALHLDVVTRLYLVRDERDLLSKR